MIHAQTFPMLTRPYFICRTIYIIGAEPIEATYDDLCQNLLYGIARLDTAIEKQVVLWEMQNAHQEKVFSTTLHVLWRNINYQSN